CVLRPSLSFPLRPPRSPHLSSLSLHDALPISLRCPQPDQPITISATAGVVFPAHGIHEHFAVVLTCPRVIPNRSLMALMIRDMGESLLVGDEGTCGGCGPGSEARSDRTGAGDGTAGGFAPVLVAAQGRGAGGCLAGAQGVEDLRIGEVRSAVLATGRTQGRDKPGGDDRLVPRAEAQLDAVGG